MKKTMTYWKLKFGAFFVLGGILLIVVVMFLWNYLMPVLFGLSQITFLQAAGLLILSKILFGSWGKKHGSHGWSHRKQWMHRMKEKWENMTPDEREKYKSHWGWAWDKSSEKQDDQ